MPTTCPTGRVNGSPGPRMDDDRQAILDWFTCASMEAAESLREALENLRKELAEETDD